MSKLFRLFSLVVPAVYGLVLVGCAKEPAAPPAVVVEEEVVEEVEVPAVASDDATDAMAGLSAADAAAAVAQKVCPVSDEALGAMGPPIKVTVKGRDVFLCCEGCREKLESSPDEFIAKLDANQAK